MILNYISELGMSPNILRATHTTAIQISHNLDLCALIYANICVSSIFRKTNLKIQIPSDTNKRTQKNTYSSERFKMKIRKNVQKDVVGNSQN